jgi:hypothetical protein
MNPYLQDILHNITTRLAKLEEAQVKKQWVSLTDDEIKNSMQGHNTQVDFARSIEAKLKERNT